MFILVTRPTISEAKCDCVTRSLRNIYEKKCNQLLSNGVLIEQQIAFGVHALCGHDNLVWFLAHNQTFFQLSHEIRKQSSFKSHHSQWLLYLSSH